MLLDRRNASTESALSTTISQGQMLTAVRSALGQFREQVSCFVQERRAVYNVKSWTRLRSDGLSESSICTRRTDGVLMRNSSVQKVIFSTRACTLSKIAYSRLYLPLKVHLTCRTAQGPISHERNVGQRGFSSGQNVEIGYRIHIVLPKSTNRRPLDYRIRTHAYI